MKTLLVVSFLLAALPVGTAESRDDSIAKLIADYGLHESAAPSAALLCNDAVMAPGTQLRWVQTVYAGVEMCVKYRDRYAREMLPLWRAPNLILTPHIAGQTAAGFAVENRVIAKNLRRYSAGERMLSVVDLEREY